MIKQYLLLIGIVIYIFIGLADLHGQSCGDANNNVDLSHLQVLDFVDNPLNTYSINNVIPVLQQRGVIVIY